MLECQKSQHSLMMHTIKLTIMIILRKETLLSYLEMRDEMLCEYIQWCAKCIYHKSSHINLNTMTYLTQNSLIYLGKNHHCHVNIMLMKSYVNIFFPELPRV